MSWKPVEVIALGDDTARVTSGLQPGEQIVALGAHLLHDGEAIRVIEQRDASVAGSQP